MDVVTPLLISLGMVMDAFAVSIGIGIGSRNKSTKSALIVAAWFGAFHGIMPCIGYAIGDSVYQHIKAYDHWVLLIVLSIIGLMLIKESISEKEEEYSADLSVKKMLPLSIAVSLDALAVGIALSVKDSGILLGAASLGMMAFVVSFVGMMAGKTFGKRFGRIAGIFGGILLIAIGVMAVIEGTMPGH